MTWANWIQSMTPRHIYILKLSSHPHLCLSIDLFRSLFPTKISEAFKISPSCYTAISSLHLDHPNNIWYRVDLHIMTVLTMQCSPAFCYLHPFRFKYYPSIPSQTLQSMLLPKSGDKASRPHKITHKTLDLYIIIFTIYGSRRKDKRRLKAFTAFNLLLISSWIKLISYRRSQKFNRCRIFEWCVTKLRLLFLWSLFLVNFIVYLYGPSFYILEILYVSFHTSLLIADGVAYDLPLPFASRFRNKPHIS
jgi:hypothetical protein